MAGAKPQKKNKRWIIPVVIVGVLAVVIYFGATALRDSRRAIEEVQVKTALVDRGDVELAVVGSGSLAADDAVEVEIPSILTIEETKVEVGDVVEQGDVLATLDAVALQASIEDVRAGIAAIDDKIDEAENSTEAAVIAAPAAGRVKEIALAEGGSIPQVMTEKGHLMVLSLDGKMQANVKSNARPGLGSELVVVLPDGTEKTGEVQRSTDTEFLVTLTDDGPAPGQEVSVRDENGAVLGNGVLEINSPLNVVGTAGTVKEINVAENDRVEKGGRLVTLRGAAASQDYVSLARERARHEELLRTLLQYADTNTVVAQTAGAVTEVTVGQESVATDGLPQMDMDSILNNLPISAPVGAAAQPRTLETAPRTLEVQPGNMACLAYREKQHAPATRGVLLAAEEQVEETPVPEEPTQEPAQEPEITELVGVVEVPLAVPALGSVPQVVVQEAEAGYVGAVQWQPAHIIFMPETSYTASILLQALPGFHFAEDIQVTVPGAEVTGRSVSTEAERNTVTFQAVFPPTEPLPQGLDLESYISGILQQGIQGATSGLDILGGMDLGDIGGSFTIDSSALGQGTGTSTVDLATSKAFTITAGKRYSIIAEIDEIDILSIKEGQDTRIVLDAMLDDTFAGKVTRVSTVGNMQSGVTTYPVTIQMDVTQAQLLGGMNATANIITTVSRDALRVPVDAIQEQGEERFVYLYDPDWQQNPENEQQLGEIRVVETGISDGVYVEILSGLGEGTEVIYTVAETNAFLDAIMTMGETQGEGGGMAAQ